LGPIFYGSICRWLNLDKSLRHVIGHGNEGGFLQELGAMKFRDPSVSDETAKVTIARVVIRFQVHGAKPMCQLDESFPIGE
jgi:hypothetical protein